MGGHGENLLNSSSSWVAVNFPNFCRSRTSTILFKISQIAQFFLQYMEMNNINYDRLEDNKHKSKFENWTNTSSWVYKQLT